MDSLQESEEGQVMQEEHADFCFICSIEAQGLLQSLSREQKEARDLLMKFRHVFMQSIYLQRQRCFTEKKIVENIRRAFNKRLRETPEVKSALKMFNMVRPWSRKSATYHLALPYPNVQNQWHQAFHTMTLISKRATATALASGDRADIKLATDMIRFQATLATQGPFMAQDATALEMDIDVPDLGGLEAAASGVVHMEQSSAQTRQRVVHAEPRSTRGRVAINQQRSVGARRRNYSDDDDDDEAANTGTAGAADGGDEASALGIFDTWGA